MISGSTLWKKLISYELTELNLPGIPSPVLSYPYLPKHLYNALEISADKFPDKPAIIDNYNHVCTYKFFLDKVNVFSDYLYKNLNIRKNCHVALMMYNSLEFCVAFFSLLKLGAVTVPLPSKYKEPEVCSLIEKADVECVICDIDFYHWFDKYIPSGMKRILCETPEKQYGFSRYRTESPQITLPDSNLNDDAIIMFTSGTTSQSKGVVIKNYNIMNAVSTYKNIFHITSRDISIIPIPIYHITGMVALLGLFISCGGTLYLHKKFNAKRVLECVKENRITFLHASPTVFSMLLEERQNFPYLPSLKTLACGSSNMPLKKMEEYHDWLPHTSFHTVYGLTETTSPATIFPGDACTSKYIGSSGLPIPGTFFEIRNESGEPVRNGEIGEIWISGNVVLTSYYKTDACCLENGWLGTGDLGYFNDDGYLFVVDRKKDMINRGGEKICSFDVENELYQIDGIEEAAVVGIPDNIYGEVAAALIKLDSNSDLDEKKIQNILSKKIAKYKIPSRIIIANKIPLTPNGKIDKRKIKTLFLK